ncbi:MAG: hypothetical protein ABJE47_23435 [bacterium]
MRGPSWKTVSTLVTMLVIAGCQDSSVTSPHNGPVAATSMKMAPAGAPSLSLEGDDAPADAAKDFTVGPAGGIFYVGRNAVVFPAQSICDPATSDYGPEAWDRPCEPLQSAITVHAVSHTSASGNWVDFSPALRFVPSSNSRQWVWMYMFIPGARGAGDVSKFNILYSSMAGAPGVDETPLDATLRTYVDTSTGFSVRRVKHFSGYQTSSGFSCTPSDDNDCSGSAVQGP